MRVCVTRLIETASLAEAATGRRAMLGIAVTACVARQHEVGFLGRSELIKNKRASGRPKDLADLALLEEGRVDVATRRAGTPQLGSYRVSNRETR